MTHSKWIFGSALGLLLTSSAFAGGPDCPPPVVPDVSGFIVGLQGGYVNNNWSDIHLNAFHMPGILVSRDYGAGVRPYVGYSFNQYFAFEFGWTYLNEASISRWDSVNFYNQRLTTIDNWAWDLSMRLSIPIFGHGGLFTRVGVAYLVSENSVMWRNNGLQALTSPVTKIDPAVFNVTYGFGAYYDLTDHVRAEVSWTRFNGEDHTNDTYQPSPDFFALGLSYRF